MRKMAQDMIIGRNPVIEALKSGRSINKLMVSEKMNDRVYRELQRPSKQAGAVTQKVPKKKIDELAQGNHHGVIAYVASYEYASLDELFAKAERENEELFFIILDELEDPHNLGSILRTADAAGVHGIIIPKRRSVGLTATVAKTSAGAIEYIPVARMTNISDAIRSEERRGE